MKRLSLLFIAFLLAGCAAAPAQPSSVSATSKVYNDTDVMFSQMMVAHHGQALEMLRLARTKAVREDVRTLAAAIEVTEADEIKTMQVWLESWGQPPTAAPGSHDGHGGAHGTDAADIAALAATSGPEFEEKFLNMLVAHQHNAIEIARMEVGSGVNPGALDLAKRIDASRTAEIQQMLRYVNEAGYSQATPSPSRSRS
ncbi:hypothetical protein GCM10010399_38390 [Dactylosporangium fulvum]|uniref:DUF305 domain-containing protein n=1 Tax=Dactylosporangium fulvum TaxID=53359 RepID=A0ABY5W496_9ACTN|nr:DUF305 domain-containing protein [Dactylosporangium fulvum]UWP84079.1 DUF305 domain-containing protein [Dactylosporangium fulvum]